MPWTWEPAGERHNPVADEECLIMLIERKSTLHTITRLCPARIPLGVAGISLRLLLVVLLLAPFATAMGAEDQSPLARVAALRLETATVGRVTVHFAAADRDYAHQLATRVEDAAGYFEREFGAPFPIQLAVLSPEHWFDPYSGGGAMPYGSPWGWIEDSLIAVPASLDEGVLILGPDGEANKRRVQFVMLHEFGHLANKRYLHPDSAHEYSSVRWLEELLATYFAYSYVQSHDPQWAESSRAEWGQFVNGYTPSVLSLDWTFMRGLPPAEFGRTYAWYQVLLNLWAAELHESHGLGFLRATRDRLPWASAGDWTNASLMPAIEAIAPGLQVRASKLEQGGSQWDVPTSAEHR